MIEEVLEQVPIVLQPPPASNGPPQLNSPQKRLVTKLYRPNNALWITWHIKFGANESQCFNSSYFKHPAVANKLWFLKVDTRNRPSLTLMCHHEMRHLNIAKANQAWRVITDRLASADDQESRLLLRQRKESTMHFLRLQQAQKILDKFLADPEDCVMVTSVCNGQVSEQHHHVCEEQIKIPIAEQLAKDPGTLLTLQLEIRVMTKGKKYSPGSDGQLWEQLLSTDGLFDVEFNSKDGQFVRAHKLVMAAFSPSLKTKFVNEEIQGSIFDTTFAAEDLKLWIDYIYRRSLIGEETKLVTIMNIFMISDYFGTETVSKHCLEQIAHRLSPSNVVAVIKHDMIYLAGDQSANFVQDAIHRMLINLPIDEIPEMELEDEKIAAFMYKVVEQTRKRKAEQAFGIQTRYPG